jgi:nucleotide-binding universal stress UspA family protein
MVFVPEAYDAELVEMGQMEKAALRFIDRELDAIGADDACPVVIEPTAVQQFPAHALVEASEDAQLVVLGRHGLGGFPHELMTPKVVQVAHHSKCGVAVVPDLWDGDGHGIVVGVDGSEHAARALRWAADEAKRRKTPFTAVMAWGLLDQRHLDPHEKYDPHYDAGTARSVLDQVISAELGDDADVERTVVNDLPARGLLEASDASELLVVGARGFGGFRDLLLGSVSHRCLARSTCPTVVIR